MTNELVLRMLNTPGYFVSFRGGDLNIANDLRQSGLARRVPEGDIFGRRGVRVYANDKGRQYARDMEERTYD